MKREDIADVIAGLRSQANYHAAMTDATGLYTSTARWLEIRSLLDRVIVILDRIGDPP